jgi:hypothetical protein
VGNGGVRWVSRPFAFEPSGLDVDQLHAGGGNDESFDGGDHVAHVRLAAADDRDRDRGSLPLVVMIDLGYGDAEPVAHPVDDRPNCGALGLERSALGNMQIETDSRGVHASIFAPSVTAPVTGPAADPGWLSGAGDLAFVEGLDEVARLQILVVLEADAALEAVADLAHVVFEPA